MRGLSPKVIIALAVIVVMTILFSLAQEMNRRMQVQKELTKLDQEVAKMEKSIIEMEQLNQYFKTDAFQERMAREKLNYRAPGEEVVLIAEETETAQTVTPNNQPEREISNPLKWWNSFFGKEAFLSTSMSLILAGLKAAG